MLHVLRFAARLCHAYLSAPPNLCPLQLHLSPPPPPPPHPPHPRQVDVYHTFFGIAGLSLMGRPGLAPIDPTFALPVEVVERLRRRRRNSSGGPVAAVFVAEGLAA